MTHTLHHTWETDRITALCYNGVYFCGNSEEQLTQTLHYNGDTDTVVIIPLAIQMDSSHKDLEETDPIATMYTTLMTTIPVVIQEDS